MSYNKIYTRFLKGIGYIFIMMMLCGCQMRENGHTITFIDDKVIEYSSDFKASDLIKAVDDYTQDDFKINDDDSLITLPDGKTVSVNISKKEIKLDTIKFEYRYMNKNYTKEVVIQDTTAPIIDCKNEYEVKLGNEYFSLENLIKCTDNFTSQKDIELFYNGSYDVNKVGEYELQVIAYDSKKNKAEKTIKIKVTEDEPTVIEKPSTENNQSISTEAGNSNNASNNSTQISSSTSNNESANSGGNTTTTTPSQPSRPSFQPSSKDFTINTYNSFEECYNACQSYINECMNQGYQGRASAEPIKEDGVYIGYRAVFN